VCPCSMGTLSAIAVGSSHNLITRAADVVLKEGRRLILVPRETPFSVIHLRNMLSLAELGAVILPANPGFYHRPTSVEQIVDFVVARTLDQLKISHDLGIHWGAMGGVRSLGSDDQD
jgi:flavin prenyltransferase